MFRRFRLYPLIPILLVGMLVVTDAANSRAGGAPQLVDLVYIATGENFPDALSAGPGTREGPILLVRKDSIPEPTFDELMRLNPKAILIFGGTAVISAEVEAQLASYTAGPVVRIAGPDRYATAAEISEALFPEVGVFSCAGRGFFGETSPQAYSYNNGLRTTGGGGVACAVALPHGTTITSMRVSARDNSDSGGVHCILERVDLRTGFFDPTLGDLEIVADVTTGGSQTPGDVEVLGSFTHVVDNSGYGYWVTCIISTGDVGLYGVIIEYRR